MFSLLSVHPFKLSTSLSLMAVDLNAHFQNSLIFICTQFHLCQFFSLFRFKKANIRSKWSHLVGSTFNLFGRIECFTLVQIKLIWPPLSHCVCVFVLVSLEIFYHSICALFLCLFIANPFLHFFFPIIRNHAFDNFLCKSISRRYKHLISLRPIKFFVCVINKIYIYF